MGPENYSQYVIFRPAVFSAEIVSSRLSQLPADARGDVAGYLSSVEGFEAVRLTEKCFLVK